MSIERAAFATDPAVVQALLSSLSQPTNLGANDIYRWYLAHHQPSGTTPSLKLNLIYPCTPKHIAKYSPQHLRVVTETPQLYHDHVQPYMRRQREAGRLDWITNILDGLTEQEDVILRDSSGTDEGFLLLPDLNWDRSTLPSLHLLALVERRDIWSLRDLTKAHVPWLKHMRSAILAATTKVYDGVEEDELKLYVHYQPTYYHFHVHVVHVLLEAGATQTVGKAFGLENLIAQLEAMEAEGGMAEVSLTYHLGEESELWKGLFGKLKSGEEPDLP